MVGGIVHSTLACAAASLVLSACAAEGSNVAVLVGGDGAGYFPLAEALTSVTRLAAEHIDEAAAALPASGVTLSAEVVDEGIRAVADLCLALDRDEDTVAVRRMRESVSGLYSRE